MLFARKNTVNTTGSAQPIRCDLKQASSDSRQFEYVNDNEIEDKVKAQHSRKFF